METGNILNLPNCNNRIVYAVRKPSVSEMGQRYKKPRPKHPLTRFSEFHKEKDYKIRGGPPRATGYENAI